MYCGFEFLVERTGLEGLMSSISGVQLSYICLVITGPKLQFPGPGRGDQVGLSGLSESGTGA